MPVGDFNPYSKELQVKCNRGKPKQRTRSELPPKEVKRLRERSGGVCEKCDRSRTHGKAHLQRRWRSTGKPVAEDFLDLCTECHEWADRTAEGRAWLEEKKTELKKELIACSGG